LLSKCRGDESAKTVKDMGGEPERKRGRERERRRDKERERGGGHHNIVVFVFLSDHVTRVRIEFPYSEHGRASLAPL
jgi:hypothetical protein